MNLSCRCAKPNTALDGTRVICKAVFTCSSPVFLSHPPLPLFLHIYFFSAAAAPKDWQEKLCSLFISGSVLSCRYSESSCVTARSLKWLNRVEQEFSVSSPVRLSGFFLTENDAEVTSCCLIQDSRKVDWGKPKRNPKLQLLQPFSSFDT